MSNNQKEKKVYTNKGYIGYVYYLNGSKAKVQLADGSALVECKTKNLNQLNWEGKQEIAFDYFIKEGKINALCFPLYRAGNPTETSIKVSKKDLENVSKYPNFMGTLEEFREFLQTIPQAVEEVHEVKVPVEEKVEETLPEEEIPEEAYEYDEEEAEEYENDSSEYEEYDDDSYYDFYNKPSSKGEWR